MIDHQQRSRQGREGKESHPGPRAGGTDEGAGGGDGERLSDEGRRGETRGVHCSVTVQIGSSLSFSGWTAGLVHCNRSRRASEGLARRVRPANGPDLRAAQHHHSNKGLRERGRYPQLITGLKEMRMTGRKCSTVDMKDRRRTGASSVETGKYEGPNWSSEWIVDSGLYQTQPTGKIFRIRKRVKREWSVFLCIEY